MTMVAQVQADEQVSLDGRYYVGAFCQEECRGVGVLDGDLLFMNIHGEGTDRIEFRLLDAQGEVYGAVNTALFQSQTQLGTVQQPYLLFFGSQDVIDEIKPVIASSDKIRAVEYYNLSGQRILNPQSSMFNGVYVRKVIYEDGTVKVSKFQ